MPTVRDMRHISEALLQRLLLYTQTFDGASTVQDMDFQCLHMNPSVYHDLLRSGDGSPEGLLAAFFDAVSAAGHRPA